MTLAEARNVPVFMLASLSLHEFAMPSASALADFPAVVAVGCLLTAPVSLYSTLNSLCMPSVSEAHQPQQELISPNSSSNAESEHFGLP